MIPGTSDSGRSSGGGGGSATMLYAAVYRKGEANHLSDSWLVDGISSTNIHELAGEIASRQTTFPELHAVQAQELKFMINATLSGFVYVVVADQQFSMVVLKDYVDAITTRFEYSFGDKTGQPDEGLEQPLVESVGRGYAEFNTVLKKLAVETQENNKGAKVRVQIDQTKQILIKNIDQVLQRNTSIEVICKETDLLSAQSESFKGGARGLRRKLTWDNIKCKLYIGIGVLVLILIILMWACNPNFSKCS